LTPPVRSALRGRRQASAHDIAAEIIRLATKEDYRDYYVVRLSDPSTPQDGCSCARRMSILISRKVDPPRIK
jgi:hypothetical protein